MSQELLRIYNRMHERALENWRPRTLRPDALTTHRYDDIARLLRGEKQRGALLEIGCGAGQMLVALADQYQHLAGLDLSDVAIATAERVVRERYPQHVDKIQLAVGSADDPLPWPDRSFDAVIACAVIEHTVDIFGVMDEIARVTRPGGAVFITVPNICYIKHTIGLALGYLPRTGSHSRDMKYWREHGWDGGHLHYFSKQALAALLRETGFEPEAWTSDGRWAKLRRWCTNLAGNLTVRARRK
jgi:ubiquinone/menaquinone biosynthesis C-methylase UbiE